MYVQWLLEFEWRIFIQGPLMIINFFTSNGIVNNISSTIRFKDKDLGIVSSLISVSIIVSIAGVLCLSIFIFKILKVIVLSKEYETKANIVQALKEFGKSFLVILTFSIMMQSLFYLFDEFAKVFDKTYHKIDEVNKNTINKIPNYIYEIITNGKTLDKNNTNFMFPSECYLDTANNMNFIVSILFVLVFAGILIWIVWSAFQKMIEVFFLYLSFPISASIGQEVEQINWKIWVKEILNKIALIFLMMLFLRLFLYMSYFIFFTLVKEETRWSNNNAKLYISFFSTLALGSAMIFITKMFSYKAKENVGFIGSFSSYKQTRNFINNNHKYQIAYDKELTNLEPINSNINSLKVEIMKVRQNDNLNYESLKKAMIFNK